MVINDLLVSSCALIDLKAARGAEAIEEMVAALAAAGRLKDPARCRADVLRRESFVTTGIGGGVALPHAVTEGVHQPVIAVGRSRTGVDVSALDGAPATAFILVLTPKGSAAFHLHILARLARLLRDHGAAQQIREAGSPEQLRAFFAQCGEALGDMDTPDALPRVCVAGAGAGGLAFAAHLALLGCRVHLYNRSEARLKPVQQLGGIMASGEIEGFARLASATTDPAAALAEATLVMVVIPATGHREMAQRLGPHLRDDHVVVLNPGRTGGALEFAAVLRELRVSSRPIIAEAQTMLYASRDQNPGSVKYFSIKHAVPVAALPAYLTPDVLTLLNAVLPHFVAGDSVLKTSLDNIGCIFHPALTLLNAAWIEERHGDFEYYREGASPSVARVLERLDQERVAVAAALGIGAVTARQWLYIAYGAAGENLYEALQANPGYQGIKAPNRLEHRYLTEDVPASLVPIASLGRQLGVPVPTLDAIILLASIVHGRDYATEGRTCRKLGLEGLDVAQIRRLAQEGVL